MNRKIKRKNSKKFLGFVSLILSGALVIGAAGCAKKPEESSAAADASGYDGEVREILIGIGSSYNPFCYLDENEELQGYDYWVTQEIQKKLPQYKFVYEATEFSNILVGLDADKYDIAVHHYGWNAERDSKYLYAQVANWGGTGYVIAAAPGLDIQSEDDLRGLSVQCSATNNTSYLLEQYNEGLPEEEQIQIVYDDASGEVLWNNIANGVYDATIVDEFSFDQANPKYGNILEKYGNDVLGDVARAEQDIIKTGTYFIYNYGDEQLRDDIDAALYELIEDGTLASLSEQHLGRDYITENVDKLLVGYEPQTKTEE